MVEEALKKSEGVGKGQSGKSLYLYEPKLLYMGMAGGLRDINPHYSYSNHK